MMLRTNRALRRRVHELERRLQTAEYTRDVQAGQLHESRRQVHYWQNHAQVRVDGLRRQLTEQNDHLVRQLAVRESTPAHGHGVRSIADERARQRSDEGWTPEHDDHHTGGQLLDAAASYLLAARTSGTVLEVLQHTPPVFWPWDRDWWKPGSVERMLAKAGALIAAELDRLARQPHPPTTAGGSTATLVVMDETHVHPAASSSRKDAP